MDRRCLVKKLGLGGLTLSYDATANPLLLVRKERRVDPHFFLFVQMPGAWDVCLAFDPKDRETLLPNGERQFDQPYSLADVREFDGIPLAPDGFALGDYSSQLAIINGIDMEIDNGHIVDTMMTGVQGARAQNAPYIQSILAKKHPYLQQCSVPHIYGAYDGQFIPGPYQMSSITSTPRDFVEFIGADASQDYYLPALLESLHPYRDRLPGRSERRIFSNYMSAVSQSVAVNGTLSDYGLEIPNDLDNPANLGSLLGQLFASGVLGSFTLALGQRYFFDTHGNHYEEHPLGAAITDICNLSNGLAQIPLMDLPGLSVLDRTTVILSSEFSRTPRLNSSLGKDHNFRTNSLVMFGHNVGRGVFGASGARVADGAWLSHAALPIDYSTGLESQTGTILKTKDLWAGCGGIFGVDLSREFGAGVMPIQFLS